MKDLLDRMEHYVRSRFYSKSETIRKGFDYLDFCYNVLMKACDGTRKWNKDKTDFESFIFGSLKSDLHNFFRKFKNEKKESSGNIVYLIEVNEYIEINEVEYKEEPQNIDFEDISKDTLHSLKEQGADELELAVFECWLSGYYKPKEIAELNDTTTIDINNAVKRLSRKTIKLREKWISLKK
jgi:hypothetical protein